MKKYLVIGDPVAHSRSPGMQNAAFEYHGLGRPYGRLRVAPEEIGEFVDYARKNLAGVNLTVPHKQIALPFVDELDESAARCGSVNTFVIENGRIRGFSTDGYGLEKALRVSFQRELEGARILFLGAGGAARATSFHLGSIGAEALFIANRSVEKAEELVRDLKSALPGVRLESLRLGEADAIAELLPELDFIIQATSLGLRDGDPAPIPAELWRTGGFRGCFFDTIYRNTPLLCAARAAGIPSADGREMLIWQGAKSFELWSGLKAPLEEMRRGFELPAEEGDGE